MGWLRRAGSVGLAASVALGLTLGVTPVAQAAATSVTVAGVVDCANNQPVTGVWIDSSRGGAGFATVTQFPNPSVAKYTRKLDMSAGSSNIVIKVGCGGTSASWGSSNQTAGTTNVHQWPGRPDDPVWINLTWCGGGYCAKISAPKGWDSKPGTVIANPFPAGQCTFGAAERWRDVMDVWPNWVGNAKDWGSAASAAGWLTFSDYPRLGSIVSIPNGPGLSGDINGHVVQVRDIAKQLDGTLLMTVYEMNFDNKGNDRISTKTWVPGKMVSIPPPYMPEGDNNYDGKVDILDMSYVGSLFGSTNRAANWRADVNDDGTISILDMSFISSWYGA